MDKEKTFTKGKIVKTRQVYSAVLKKEDIFKLAL